MKSLSMRRLPTPLLAVPGSSGRSSPENLVLVLLGVGDESGGFVDDVEGREDDVHVRGGLKERGEGNETWVSLRIERERREENR